MQPPPPTGTTGSAPPLPLGPPGLLGGAGASLDIAFVAVVSGASALAPAPTTAAPHPTIKTNRLALARSAAFDLPMFLILLNLIGVVGSLVFGEAAGALWCSTPCR